MKKGIAIMILLVLLLSVSVLAQEMTQEELAEVLNSDPELQELLEENPELLDELDGASAEDIQMLIFRYGLEEMKESFNSNQADVPAIVLTLFGNEKINIYLENELIMGVAMEDGKITDINTEGLEDPTVEIYMTEEFMAQLNSGQMNFEDALASGDLSYNGVGFFNKIKFGLLKIFSGLFM